MLEPIDVHQKLIQERKKEVNADSIIGWAYSVLNPNENNEQTILNRLSNSPLERDINNFSIEDISAIYNLSTSNIKVKLHRLRSQLEKLIKENCYEYYN